MASSQENMDIDLVEESTVQLEADMAVTRCLFEGGVRRVVSDIDKDLARLGMKNRCPKPIHSKGLQTMTNHVLTHSYIKKPCECTDGCRTMANCRCRKEGYFCQSHDPDVTRAQLAKKPNFTCKCVNCANVYQDWSDIKEGDSKIDGQGLIADRNFLRNEIVCELVGDFEQVKNDSSTQIVSNNIVVNGLGKFVYNIYADDHNVIKLECDISDPSSKVNHSCMPNATFQQLYYCGYLVIVIRALKKIQKGEEITVDYGHKFGRIGIMGCNCQSPGCKKKISGKISAAEMIGALGRYKEASKVLERYASQIPNVGKDFQDRIDTMDIRTNYFASLERDGVIDHDSLPVCRAGERKQGRSVTTQTSCPSAPEPSAMIVPVDDLEEKLKELEQIIKSKDEELKRAHSTIGEKDEMIRNLTDRLNAVEVTSAPESVAGSSSSIANFVVTDDNGENLLKQQIEFVKKVLTNSTPLSKCGLWICELCDDPKPTWKKNEKQKLIRHILKFDNGHWRAAVVIGKEAFCKNQEYRTGFETLEKKTEVAKFLKSQRAAQE